MTHVLSWMGQIAGLPVLKAQAASAFPGPQVCRDPHAPRANAHPIPHHRWEFPCDLTKPKNRGINNLLSLMSCASYITYVKMRPAFTTTKTPNKGMDQKSSLPCSSTSAENSSRASKIVKGRSHRIGAFLPSSCLPAQDSCTREAQPCAVNSTLWRVTQADPKPS